MSYCYNCGKPVEDGKDFLCKECRDKLNATKKELNNEITAVKPKKKFKLPLAATIITGIAVSLLYLLLLGSTDTDGSDIFGFEFFMIICPCLIVGFVTGLISLIKTIKARAKLGEKNTAALVLSIIATALSSVVLTCIVIAAGAAISFTMLIILFIAALAGV